MSSLPVASAPPAFLKLLAHDLRWNLLVHLAHSDYRVQGLVEHVARPMNLVSYHLAQLRRSNLVTERRSSEDGRDVYYMLDLDYLQAQLQTAAGPCIRRSCRRRLPPGPCRRLRTQPRSRCSFFVRTTARSQMAKALLRHHGGPKSRRAAPAPKCGRFTRWPLKQWSLSVWISATNGPNISTSFVATPLPASSPFVTGCASNVLSFRRAQGNSLEHCRSRRRRRGINAAPGVHRDGAPDRLAGAPLPAGAPASTDQPAALNWLIQKGTFMPQPGLLHRTAAELFGTYALVTAGCGAIVVNSQTGALGHVGIALTFALVVVVMVAATGHLSGAHLNPAVTIAFAATRHFPWREAPVYIGGQMAGAIAGAWTLLALFGPVVNLGATIPSGTAWQSLALETLITAALMFVITAVATDTHAVGELAALAIGFTIGANALWAGPISGASMNPARSLGPALVAGAWQEQWIYIVGPVIGATWVLSSISGCVNRSLCLHLPWHRPKTAQRVLPNLNHRHKQQLINLTR